MVIQISQPMGTGTLKETLQRLQAGEDELLDPQAGLATVAPKASADSLSLSDEAKSLSGGNMMSRNFAGGRGNDGSYVDAQMAGLRASKQMNLSQDKTMTSVLDAFGGIAGPSMYDPHDNKKTGGGAASEHEIRQHLERESTKKFMEEKQEELRREKEAQRAAEAEALASGDMVTTEPNETEIAAGDGQTAPMPEISGSTPAAAADIAPALSAPVATAPAPEVAAASAPGVSASAEPTAQSIDVTV